MSAKFEAGHNIAMKVPSHQYEATIAFYRDILGLPQIGGPDEKYVSFQFGGNRLWIDETPAMSQAELWLEVVTDDTKAAAEILAEAGVTRCDAIEDIGDLDGFWISNPANIIHLVNVKKEQ